MPSDTPDLSRAALEAHARYLDDYATVRAERLHEIAATLRALASRAEPPADVAALVEEARAYAHAELDETGRSYMLDLAAALTAQAERIQELEKAAELEETWPDWGEKLYKFMAKERQDYRYEDEIDLVGDVIEHVMFVEQAAEDERRKADAALARAEKAEALLREAQSVLERVGEAVDSDWLIMSEVEWDASVEPAGEAARALAAKLKQGA